MAELPSLMQISVIIRSTGRGELLQALDSLGRQTCPAVEILLVDATGLGVVSGLVSGYVDLPIRVLNQDRPLNRSRAANLGLDNARGDAVLFLDDDDWLEPNHLERLGIALGGEPSAIAAYSGVRCDQLNPDTGQTETVRLYNEPYDPVRLMTENYIPIHGLVFRRQAIDPPHACRFAEDMDLYEDWDFWLQIMPLGGFVHVPEVTAVYRIHPEGGEGVQADEVKSVKALEQLLDKWRLRWSPGQLRDLVARMRLSTKLLADQNRHIDRQAEDLSGFQTQAHGLAVERDQWARRASELEAGAITRQRQLEDMTQTLNRLEQERDSLVQGLSVAQDDLARTQAHLAEVENNLAETQSALAALQAWRASLEHTKAFRLYKRGQRWLHWGRIAGSLLLGGRFRELAWRILLRLYTWGPAQGLIGRIPFTWKRRVRNFFSRGQQAAPAPEFTGHLPAQPLVSLIIPVYQHADYLSQCIGSALEQQYPHVEVIVVDDASPDPAVQEVLQTLASHPRLTLLRNETNQGIARTQNRALLASRGAIIGFLDCDDFLTPDAVDTCLRYWTGETVYSHSARVNIDAQNQEVSRICFQHLPRQDYFEENLAAMYATHFKMIRRDVFARLGLFDPRFDTAQDYDYLMRVAAHYPSHGFTYIPHFVYYHRFHERQATEQQNDRQAAAVAIIQHEARLRREIQSGRFDRRLSFIMLSFGKHSQTLEAILSLKNTVRVPHEIIVFDNGSDQETVAFLKARVDGQFPDVRVYYNDTNLGPAAGRREALRHATGDWFIVFDNDEIAEPGWLEELLVRASSDPTIGVVTCKVIFPNQELQCCGGYIEPAEEDVIELKLIDRGVNTYALESAEFKECDWCPIGATLFTRSPLPYLHAGYPNVFEDAGVSMAFRRQGLRLVNSPASWVWHEHVTFRKTVEMGARYTKERYDPKRMLISVASFYKENGKIIHDEYVWRENQLNRDDLAAVRRLLVDTAQATYPGPSVAPE